MKIASNCEKSEFFNSDTATVILLRHFANKREHNMIQARLSCLQALQRCIYGFQFDKILCSLREAVVRSTSTWYGMLM